MDSLRGALSATFRNQMIEEVLTNEHRLHSKREELLKALKKAGIPNFKNGLKAGKQLLRRVAADGGNDLLPLLTIANPRAVATTFPVASPAR